VTKLASVLIMTLAASLCAAQVPTSGARPEQVTALAPGVTASTRLSEQLEVPRPQRARVSVRAELGTWQLRGATREIRVPPQGFYIAELGNGTVTTIINGKETERTAGDVWAVEAGETMTVRITNPKQQSALLHVFSVRPIP
jgi:hypothetical protein